MDSMAEDLHRVAAGLRLVLWGLVVAVVNVAAGLAVVFSLADPGRDPAAMLAGLTREHPTALTLLIGLGVLSNVLAITGKVFCLWTPRIAGATQYILMATACGGIGLGLSVAAQAADLGPEATDFAHTSPLFTIIGFLFFVRYLRRLSAFLDSAPLLLRAQRVQAGTTVLLVVYLVASIGSTAGMANATTAVVAVLLAAGILAICVMYARLINGLQAVTEATARSHD